MPAYLSMKSDDDKDLALIYWLVWIHGEIVNMTLLQRANGTLSKDVDTAKLIDFYCQINSLEMNCARGAKLAATICNQGINPTSNKWSIFLPIARLTVSLQQMHGPQKSETHSEYDEQLWNEWFLREMERIDRHSCKVQFEWSCVVSSTQIIWNVHLLTIDWWKRSKHKSNRILQTSFTKVSISQNTQIVKH